MSLWFLVYLPSRVRTTRTTKEATSQLPQGSSDCPEVIWTSGELCGNQPVAYMDLPVVPCCRDPLPTLLLVRKNTRPQADSGSEESCQQVKAQGSYRERAAHCNPLSFDPPWLFLLGGQRPGWVGGALLTLVCVLSTGPPALGLLGLPVGSGKPAAPLLGWDMLLTFTTPWTWSCCSCPFCLSSLHPELNLISRSLSI